MIDQHSANPSPDENPKEQTLYPSTLYIFRVAHLSEELAKGSGDEIWYDAARQLEEITQKGKQNLTERIYNTQRSVASEDKLYTEPDLRECLMEAMEGALRVLALEPVENPKQVYGLIKGICGVCPSAHQPLTETFLETNFRTYRLRLLDAAAEMGQTQELDLLQRALPEFEIKGTNYGRALLEVKDLLRDVAVLDSVSHPYRFNVGQLLQPAVKRLINLDGAKSLSSFVGSVIDAGEGLEFTLEQLLTPSLEQIRDGAFNHEALIELLKKDEVCEWINGRHLQLLGTPCNVKRQMVRALYEKMRDVPNEESGEASSGYLASTKLLAWLGQWKQHTALTYLNKEDLFDAKNHDEANGFAEATKQLWPNLLVIAMGSKRHGHLAIQAIVDELASGRGEWKSTLEPLMIHALHNHLEGVLLHCMSNKHPVSATSSVFDILARDGSHSDSSRMIIARLKLLSNEDKLHTLFPPNVMKDSWKMILKSAISSL